MWPSSSNRMFEGYRYSGNKNKTHTYMYMYIFAVHHNPHPQLHNTDTHLIQKQLKFEFFCWFNFICSDFPFTCWAMSVYYSASKSFQICWVLSGKFLPKKLSKLWSMHTNKLQRKYMQFQPECGWILTLHNTHTHIHTLSLFLSRTERKSVSPHNFHQRLRIDYINFERKLLGERLVVVDRER